MIQSRHLSNNISHRTRCDSLLFPGKSSELTCRVWLFPPVSQSGESSGESVSRHLSGNVSHRTRCDNNNNNVHLSCAHQRPERSHDTYQPKYDIIYTCTDVERSPTKTIYIKYYKTY